MTLRFDTFDLTSPIRHLDLTSRFDIAALTPDLFPPLYNGGGSDGGFVGRWIGIDYFRDVTEVNVDKYIMCNIKKVRNVINVDNRDWFRFIFKELLRAYIYLDFRLLEVLLLVQNEDIVNSGAE